MANGNTYTLQEFGQKVKDKYPEYNDVDNTELAKKVLVKYPEYNEFIVKEQEDVQAAVGAGYGDYYFNATPDEVKEMSSEIDEQNEVRLPVPDETKDKDVNVARSMWSSFQAGSAGLGAGIARVPAFIYDLAAMPQNKLSQLPGLSGLEVTAPEWLRDNPIAVYYDKQVELLNETKKKYDKTITGYLKVGEYGKALGLLGNEVTETLPLMVGLAMGGYAGIGYTQSIAGMGALSGAEKRKEIEDIDASEVVKTWIALIHGLAEGIMESLGTMKIAAIGRQLYSKLGTKAADKAIKKGFMASLGGAMKRFYPITGAIGEGIEEAATTFTQNLNDRFNNVDPERNPFDGVNDSFIVGAAAGGLMTGTIATTSKIQKKGAVELNQEPIVEEKVKEEEIKPTEPKIEPVTEEKEVTKGKVSVEEKKPSGEEIEVAKVKEKEAEISKEVKLKEEEEYKKKGPEGLRAMRGP